MEVKTIERWGADWERVVVGRAAHGREASTRRPPEPHDRHARGRREPLSIVCGATNIAPGQRIPVALPGAVLPGDRRIERAEKMGVVSNGMLCSGDELRPHGRRRRDPHPARRHAARASRWSTSTATIVLDVDVKPNRGDALSIVGLAREVAAATGADRALARDRRRGGERARDRRTARRRRPRPGPVHALRRPLGERRADRAVARPRPDAAAGGRAAARSRTSSTPRTT